ncbi:MAG TPA: saccharopine dehydrogenase NADP-binding domain-containing protein [Oligoflexia bacterium]|nr:saccharopine dehydrogenase NADP-binding domain-containing protein [Oligoflexia bacterium]
MTHHKWLLYGAYGYTGRMITGEALKRGHRPVLAGRSASALQEFAKNFALDTLVFDLDHPNLVNIVRGFNLVFNAAGPFSKTSEPLVRACLEASVNYVDITGEVAVFEKNFSYDAAAKKQGIVILSGVGFDVVPTDCAAKQVCDRVPQATDLEIAFAISTGGSTGTLSTALEAAPQGILERRAGQIVPISHFSDNKRVAFMDRSRTVMPITWGDLATAYRTTGVPNISTYVAVSPAVAAGTRLFGKFVFSLLKNSLVRRLAQWLIKLLIKNPNPTTSWNAKSYVWARARNNEGRQAEVQIELPCGPYPFTAVAGVASVERIFRDRPTGATTPALAFGTDFLSSLPGTKILNT